MSFINTFLSSFFGKKSDRDIKEIQPLIEKIPLVFAELQSLTHDELRQRSFDLKSRIRESVKKKNLLRFRN
ncbi:MAG: hypothetical protein U0T82_17280 [Bacteroidales bacterium]